MVRTITEWQVVAMNCWKIRTRPSGECISAAFPGIDDDIAAFIQNLRNFEISPSEARAISGVFFCYSEVVKDFCLLPCMRAALVNRQETDVTVMLIAKHVSKLGQQEIMDRFSNEEVHVIHDYFRLIGALRGFLHPGEATAIEACNHAN